MVGQWVESGDADWTAAEPADALGQFLEPGVQRVDVVVEGQSGPGIDVLLFELVTD